LFFVSFTSVHHNPVFEQDTLTFFRFRCYFWYWRRRNSDKCYDNRLGCRLTGEAWKISGDTWYGGCHGELYRPTRRRHIHGESLVALVFCKICFYSYLDTANISQKYINIPLTSIAMIIVTLVLPLKRVKGNAKEKLKKIDYLGSFIMLSSSLLILLPLSWSAHLLWRLLANADQILGEEQSILGTRQVSSLHWSSGLSYFAYSS